jgi:hypothetical protein
MEPGQGPTGILITVYGYNYAGATCLIYWEGRDAITTTQPCVINTSGVFITQFRVPEDSAAGPQLVAAVDSLGRWNYETFYVMEQKKNIYLPLISR